MCDRPIYPLGVCGETTHVAAPVGHVHRAVVAHFVHVAGQGVAQAGVLPRAGERFVFVPRYVGLGVKFGEIARL